MATERDKTKIKNAIKRRRKEVYTPVVPDMQLGFVHNNVDCIGCRACEIACKDKNGLAAGPRFRRVQYIEGGTFPDVFAYKVNMSCNHCAQPACLPACPTGAIYKRKKDGIVDIDSTLCIGCRRCEATCPYGAPQYDPMDGLVKKCNMCVDELDAGRRPYCVMACMMRVLDIGPIDWIWASKLNTKAVGPNDTVVRQVKNMADPELTNPSIGFVPHKKGKVS
ncbi:MAG: 4Fe-4S dicluster domain-containing protein [Gammaproteobacteria bacterium]|jgi:anaerobic dimethyl sulfoxide reductase subunit B (iron-sulfur subunit)